MKNAIRVTKVFLYTYLVTTFYDIKKAVTIEKAFIGFGLLTLFYIWVMLFRVLYFNLNQIEILLPMPNIIVGIIAIFVLPILAHILLTKEK